MERSPFSAPPKLRNAGYEAICHTAGLLAAVEQKENLRTADVAEVRRSSIKWRPKCVALNNPTLTFTFNPNQNAPKRLRFNPILIAEWLQELLDAGKAESQNKLATSLGRSRTQVMQYLRLLTLPPKMLAELRLDPNLREGHLRALTKDVREGKFVTMRKVKLAAQGGTRKPKSTGRVVSQA